MENVRGTLQKKQVRELYCAFRLCSRLTSLFQEELAAMKVLSLPSPKRIAVIFFSSCAVMAMQVG